MELGHRSWWSRIDKRVCVVSHPSQVSVRKLVLEDGRIQTFQAKKSHVVRRFAWWKWNVLLFYRLCRCLESDARGNVRFTITQLILEKGFYL